MSSRTDPSSAFYNGASTNGDDEPLTHKVSIFVERKQAHFPVELQVLHVGSKRRASDVTLEARRPSTLKLSFCDFQGIPCLVSSEPVRSLVRRDRLSHVVCVDDIYSFNLTSRYVIVSHDNLVVSEDPCVLIVDVNRTMRAPKNTVPPAQSSVRL